MANGTEYENCYDDAHWYVPCDDFSYEHICKTQKHGKGTNLAYGSSTGIGIVAEQQVKAVGDIVQQGSVSCLYGFLHVV